MIDFSIMLYWQLSEDQLTEVYETARTEGVLSLVAFDVQASEELFLIFARQAEVFGVVYGPDGRPLGFFYLTGFEGSTARAHFCYFQAGRERRGVIGRAVLDWCFSTFELRSLIGVIPSINPGACRYAREMGGREMGLIPGLCWIARLRRCVGGVQFVFTKGEDHGRDVQ